MLQRAAPLLHRPNWLVFARRFSSLEPPPQEGGVGCVKRPENPFEPNGINEYKQVFTLLACMESILLACRILAKSGERPTLAANNNAAF
jgi:hypothetical protein